MKELLLEVDKLIKDSLTKWSVCYNNQLTKRLRMFYKFEFFLDITAAI